MTKQEMMNKIADLTEECPETDAAECNRCPLIKFCVGCLTGDWGSNDTETEPRE